MREGPRASLPTLLPAHHPATQEGEDRPRPREDDDDRSRYQAAVMAQPGKCGKGGKGGEGGVAGEGSGWTVVPDGGREQSLHRFLQQAAPGSVDPGLQQDSHQTLLQLDHPQGLLLHHAQDHRPQEPRLRPRHHRPGRGQTHPQVSPLLLFRVPHGRDEGQQPREGEGPRAVAQGRRRGDCGPAECTGADGGEHSGAKPAFLLQRDACGGDSDQQLHDGKADDSLRELQAPGRPLHAQRPVISDNCDRNGYHPPRHQAWIAVFMGRGMAGQIDDCYNLIMIAGEAGGCQGKCRCCSITINTVVSSFFLIMIFVYAADMSDLSSQISNLENRSISQIACVDVCGSYYRYEFNLLVCCIYSDGSYCIGKQQCRTKKINLLDDSYSRYETLTITFTAILIILTTISCYCCKQIQRPPNPPNHDSYSNLITAINKSENKIDTYYESFAYQDTETNCAVCLEDFKDEKAILLKCGHIYHSRCIRDWAQKQQNCPVCRSSQ